MKKSKKAPKNKSKEPKKLNKKILAAIIVGVLAIFIAAGAFSYVEYNKYLEVQAQNAADDAVIKQATYELAISTFHRHAVEDVSADTGRGIADFLTGIAHNTLDGIKNRPPYVKLTPEQIPSFCSVESVLLDEEDPSIVDVHVNVSQYALPISDDGYYYLLAQPLYSNEVPKTPVSRLEKNTEFTITCDLNYNSSSSVLFDKFCVALLMDGEYVPVSNSMYITNPGARAGYASARDGVGSKKGLLVYSELIHSGQLADLGVKHAAYNVYTSLICNGGGISYTYNGHTYSFNAYQVGLYDIIFSGLSNQGIDVNAIIINDLSNSTITYPGSRGAGATLYAFNTADEEGVNMVAAVASFLAKRYSGAGGHGKVANWIIGNEVNERAIYNYTPSMGLSEYAKLYADTVRVFYNAMCSVNSSTRVYVSFDNRWDMNKSDGSFYDVRDMLDAYNSYIVSEGNFDWNMGFHPYNYPLDAPRVWNCGRYDSMVGNSASSPIISMRNIHVLTDYLGQQSYLDTNGSVRHVILSEMGYTSSQGAELQAASIAYAYKVMEANSHIDYMLLSRQMDHGAEVSGGMALGIVGKPAYSVFKACGTAEESSVIDKYLGMIGIGSWSQIQNRR